MRASREEELNCGVHPPDLTKAASSYLWPRISGILRVHRLMRPLLSSPPPPPPLAETTPFTHPQLPLMPREQAGFHHHS
ncbi:unnamed protein product [Arctogadus glacialis]